MSNDAPKVSGNKPKNPLFAKMARAKPSMGGNWLRDGRYKLMVKRILQEKKESGECFIVEFLVLESHDMSDAWAKGSTACWPGEEGATLVKANPVGSSPSLVLILDNGNKSAMGNAVAFVCGLLGEEPEVVEQDPDDFGAAMEALCEKDQPARGMLINLETYRKPIKSGPNAGKPFVNKRWEHVGDQSDDAIAARRAELDKSDKAEKAA